MPPTYSGVSTRPDVWTLPATGIEWCDCGEDHVLTRADVAARYDAHVGADGRVPHPVVVQVTQEIWRYESVCRFFHLRVEVAAREVAGAVLVSYVVGDAIDISGTFSRAWQGCPEEGCAGA